MPRRIFDTLIIGGMAAVLLSFTWYIGYQRGRQVAAEEAMPFEECLAVPCNEMACDELIERERQVLHSEVVNEALNELEGCWRLNSRCYQSLHDCEQQR